MSKFLKFFSLCLIISCSTAETWERYTIAPKDKKWRWCSKEKDGEERHAKGICFIEKECSKKLFKTYCRNVWDVCEYGPNFTQCLMEKEVWGMRISN